MPRTLEYTESLTVTKCWCGMAHAIPTTLYDYVHRQHEQYNKEHFVYCPLGHTWTPAGKSKLDRERELREAAEAREIALADQLNAEQRANAKARKEAKRIATRTAGGVCPCCNRSFVQLARHMKGQHPEYAS